jgi:hypothetical protein
MNPLQTFGAAQAPSNMMFPTAAYLQSSQNAAETRARGMEALGKGIAGGISAVAGAYGDYKNMQSGVKSSEKAYETFKSFLDPEVRNEIDAQIEQVNNDPNMSLRDKAAFWEKAKGYIGGSVNQNFALQKQQQQLKAEAELQAARITSQEGQPMRNAVANYLFPEERQPNAPTSMFGPTQIPQQTSFYSPAPQNTFAAPRRFSIHTQRPEER